MWGLKNLQKKDVEIKKTKTNNPICICILVDMDFFLGRNVKSIYGFDVFENVFLITSLQNVKLNTY